MKSIARRKTIRLRRRGMALIVVLGVMAMTLAISYSLLRNQSFDQKMQANQGRNFDARTAAQVGMSTALRKMCDGTWSGADTSFTNNLDSAGTTGFVVTFTTGDSSLTAGSADYAKYPFRITVLSKGYVVDPTGSSAQSEYQIQSVVELVRRKLNTNTATLSTLEQYTVYQYGNSTVDLHYPFRMNGGVMFQGTVNFNVNYPLLHNGLEFDRYMKDIDKMYTDGVRDARPFSGTVYTPDSMQSSTGDFDLTVNNRIKTAYEYVAVNRTAPVPQIGTVTSYKLFTGGKSYTTTGAIPVTNDSSGSPAEKVVPAGTYTASPLTNPLGVYSINSTSLRIPSNTSITGSILSYGSTSSSDLHISGSTITLNPTVLPAISGDSTVYQLPLIHAADDVRVWDGTSRTVNGLIVARDEFEITAGSDTARLTYQGTAAANTVMIGERNSWNRVLTYWTLTHTGFLLGLGTSSSYYPEWLALNRSSDGFYLTPRIILSGTSSGIKYHVPDWSQPIYTSNSADGGLLWDVVSWKEPFGTAN